MRKLTPAEWDAQEALLRQLTDPTLRDAMIEAGRAAREQAEALERGDQGKNRGKFDEPALHIRKIMAANPTVKKPSALRKLMDKEIVGHMNADAFYSACRRARKLVAPGRD